MADVLTLPVRTIVAATPRTRVLRLDLQGAPFAFRPGQAALIGLHGQPRRRPYSIASSPDDAVRHGRLEFLLKVDTTGYAGPHLPDVYRGAKVDLEGPVGSFTLPAAPHPPAGYFFVAGGTGISPLRSMLRQLLADRECPPISVLYSAKAPEEFSYGAELRRMARHGMLRVTCTVTGDAGPAWAGGRGRIDAIQLRQALPSLDALCFICGPPALVEAVPPLLWHIGVPAGHVRTEEW